MKTLKHSKQREAIKEYLVSTNSHPTADAVYLHVKEDFPNISLGTVYRNLNLLADLGEITKITTPDGADRLDACTKPHYHFYCKECKRVFDMPLNTIESIDQIAAENFDGEIDSHTIMFCGTCADCKMRKRSS